MNFYGCTEKTNEKTVCLVAVKLRLKKIPYTKREAEKIIYFFY